jgi:hypothetical protein
MHRFRFQCDFGFAHDGVFGISAIVENKIFAEICPVLQTEEAFIAWSRIRRNNAHARSESITYSVAGQFHHSGKLVAEAIWRIPHHRKMTRDELHAAAAEIAFNNFENIFPRFLSVISFLCFIPAQCECPDMICLDYILRI